MLAARVNGSAVSEPGSSIAIDDRGLNYGDGLFETMLLMQGRIRFLNLHLERLRSSCARLGILYPGDELLEQDIDAVRGSHPDGVVKILLTRGVGGRGYRPIANSPATRIVSLHSMPTFRTELHATWCETRVSRNPVLAGMKHTNRLEQVLAAAEWSDADIDEGLMLDIEGEVVCGTSSNVFIVRGGELVTPDLRFSGVRGVMRGQVLRIAGTLGIPCHEEPVYPQDVDTASEVFVTNAVRGIRSVVQLAEQHWSPGPITTALRDALNAHA